MSWNFILLIFINVCQVRWIVIVGPGSNYVPDPDGELLCGECPGIIKTMHTGFKTRTHVALCQRPGADTEETGRYDLAWKDLCEWYECSQ